MRRRLMLFCVAVFATRSAGAQAPEDVEFFEKRIRPLLVRNCQGCHNPKVKTSGLDMSTAAAFFAGAASGALTDKAKPESSLLLQVISYEGRPKMPPAGKLPAEAIADLTLWVKAGAPWPGFDPMKSANVGQAPHSSPTGGPTIRKHGRPLTDKDAQYWAFQPVRNPAPPAVKDAAWVQSPVDRFILAALEAKGLKPAPPADRVTLLRRVTYDLTGLPPTEAEIGAFLGDASPTAFATVVDRLLASPRYGERWGRHWLDVARYADSTGNDEDHRYPYAWRYRDYVIESFNNDLPYNQFIREQIAGDLMPGEGGTPNRRGIIATGFLALGAKAIAQQDKQKMLYDVYDEQLDVTSKAFLGLTMACARCHDHKFDPIQQKDYYSFVSFFANTRSFKDPSTHVSKLLYVPLVPKAEYAKYRAYQDRVSAKKLEIEDVMEQEKERYSAALAPRLADYLLAARAVQGGAKPNELAIERKLDAKILGKWVKYFQQDARAKPHLGPWSQASTSEQVAAAAATYQQGYLAQMTKWNERVAKWRENARRMLKEMNMPPPPRPDFKAEEDGFFFDIYIDRKGPFALSLADQESVYSPEAKATLAKLKQEQEELKKNAIPEPEMACGVEDGDPVDQKVFVRGDYANLGEPAPKAFPMILGKPGDPQPGTGSGRLALADWLASPANPLPARVMANRIWLRHFAEGVVRTPDNFGVTGERPTNPELLDYLASQFVAGNWSVKRLHRQILLSSAYQMSSEVSPESYQKDPENRLLSRFNRRRLDIEEIRDGLLLADGSLDTQMGGTMQSGFGTDGENSSGRLSLNPEKEKRRMVYLPIRRANLPALLNLFDFGDATTMQGKRQMTNIAPQALFMMNSEFLTDRSLNLAKSLAEDPPARRVERLYLRTLSRRPASEETDAALSYVETYRQRFGGANAERDAWQSIARVLMASNDFIYVD
ncbi:MAG: PSD1 and planctomycete cytochrome C domain-containing protein [Bryobacteraceae bacterium]|nr:PSD1 and planctomycete cytochrome C domain-containing protein [Bryobacteraceae bacterium]